MEVFTNVIVASKILPLCEYITERQREKEKEKEKEKERKREREKKMKKKKEQEKETRKTFTRRKTSTPGVQRCVHMLLSLLRMMQYCINHK